jgi:hypothetical protein
MKLYVLNGNGRVLFDFSEKSGGCGIDVSLEEQVKITVLLGAALESLKASRSDRERTEVRK